MFYVDDVWIYDPLKELSARKLKLGPRQKILKNRPTTYAFTSTSINI
jgi:hypothetical protein